MFINQTEKMEKGNNWLGVSERAVRTSDCPIWIKDEMTGLCYALPYGEHVIGRKDDVENDIPVRTEDVFMSRRHAVLTVTQNLLEETEVCIRVLEGAANPVFVKLPPVAGGHQPEFQPLGPDTSFLLFDGSCFILGKSLFTLHYRLAKDSVFS